MKKLAILAFFLSVAAHAKGGELAFLAPESVSTGNGHACAIAQGKVYCWGRNDHGQTDVPELDNPRMVAAGEDHTCALDAKGVKCWGSNQFGQLNVPPLTKPEKIYAGLHISCAIADSLPKCWGNTNFPKLINGPKIVAPGESHICVLDAEGVKCYTEDVFENLHEKWDQVPALTNVRALVSGNGFTCALSDQGVTCWRKDGAPQMEVPPLNQPRSIVAHENHACGIDADGVKCWGSNQYGESNVPKLTNARFVTTGGSHACAIADEGVKCWGKNESGESNPPALDNATEVSASHDYSCAIAADRVTCWGKGAENYGKYYNENVARGYNRHTRGLVSNARQTCYYFDRQTYPSNPVEIGETCEVNGGSSGGDGSHFLSRTMSDRFKCSIYDGKEARCEVDVPGKWVSFPFPPSYPINRMALGAGRICLVFRNAVSCWNGSSFRDEWSNFDYRGSDDYRPRAIDASIGEFGFCVRTSRDKVECGYRGNDTVPEFKAGDGLGSGAHHACSAVLGSGVRCWGNNQFGQSTAPAMGQIQSLSTWGNYNCAVDGRGLQCWGESKFGQLDFLASMQSAEATLENPRFHLNQLGSFLAVAKQVSGDARGRVLAEAARLTAALPMKDITLPASQARFLLASLMELVIASQESSYARSTLVPAFHDSIAGFRKVLRVSGVESIPRTPKNISNALPVLQAAVAVSGEFLSPEDRSSLQGAQRAIGQAMSVPGDAEKVRAAVEAMNGASPTLEKLSRNSKSVFLVDTIHAATTWLKGTQ